MPPKLSTPATARSTSAAPSTKPSASLRVSPWPSWCASLPDVIFDMIASMVTTRDRLLRIERTCRVWYHLSSHGAGYATELDLSWLSSTISWPTVVTHLGQRLYSSRARLQAMRINASMLCNAWRRSDEVVAPLSKTRCVVHREWVRDWGHWPALQRIVVHITETDAPQFKPAWIVGHDILSPDEHPYYNGDTSDEDTDTKRQGDATTIVPAVSPVPILDTLHLICHFVTKMTLHLPPLPTLRHFRSVAIPDVPASTTHTNCTIVCRELPSLLTFVGGSGHRISCGVASGEPRDWDAPLLQSLTLGNPTFYHHWYRMIACAGANLLSLHDRLLSSDDIEYIRQHATSLQVLQITRFYRGALNKALASVAQMTTLRELTCDRAGADFSPREEDNQGASEPKDEWHQLLTLTQLQRLNVIDYSGDHTHIGALRELVRYLNREGCLTYVNGQPVEQWMTTPLMDTTRRLKYSPM